MKAPLGFRDLGELTTIEEELLNQAGIFVSAITFRCYHCNKLAVSSLVNK
jgi:hypothetical protein